MAWLIQEKRLRPWQADYMVNTLRLSQNCLHWGEPRVWKRDHFQLGVDDLRVVKTETLNPWFEAADVAVAAAGGTIPSDTAKHIATPEQLAQLAQYGYSLLEYTPAPQEIAPDHYEVRFHAREKGEDSGDETRTAGWLTMNMKQSGKIWKLESFSFEPDKDPNAAEPK